MKKMIGIVSVFFILSIAASACGPSPAPTEAAVEAADQVDTEAQIQTAIAQTAAVQTAEAPPPTDAPTSTPDYTDTPAPTNTAMIVEEPTIEPTSENPWVLQPWCEEHVGCEKMEVKNQSPYWANIYLEYTDTGVNKYFSVAPKGHAWITLRPGHYQYVITACGGEHVWSGYHGFNSNWYFIIKDKFCN